MPGDTRQQRQSGVTQPTVADLPLRDQLLHGIGRVAQAQVQLDMTIRHLFASLATPGLAVWLAPARHSTRPLIDDCQIMVANSELADDIKAAGKEALSDATDAEALRNRVVHDWWTHSVGEDSAAPSLERVRLHNKRGGISYCAEPADLTYIEVAYDRLSRASIRLTSLDFAARDLLFKRVGQDRVRFDPEELLAEIRGDFDLLPDGGWRPRNIAQKFG